MSMSDPRASCLMIPLLFVILLTQGTEGCTPVEPPTFQELVDLSAAIVMGQVRRIIPDNRFSDAYTAEMDIYCIPKTPTEGPEIKQRHNISEAGFIPGKCFDAKLETGKLYIVLLYTSADNYIPIDVPMEATAEHITQLSQACGLSPTIPEGASGYVERPGTTSRMMCPSSVDDTGCLVNRSDNKDGNRGDIPESDPGQAGSQAGAEPNGDSDLTGSGSKGNMVLGTLMSFVGVLILVF